MPHLTRAAYASSDTASPGCPTQMAPRPFKSYPIGYFHIDIAEVHTEQGKLYLAHRPNSLRRTHERVADAPPPISSTPSSKAGRIGHRAADNGTHCPETSAQRPQRLAIQNGELFSAAFEYASAKAETIDSQAADGQVERMNRTIKDCHRQATLRRLPSISASSSPLTTMRLKTLKGRLPIHLQNLANRAKTIHTRLHQMPGRSSRRLYVAV